MDWKLEPQIIEGKRIQLEPISETHFDALCECLLNEPDGWFSRMFNFNTPDAIQKTILSSIKVNQERRGLAFVIRDFHSGNVAGFSNFMRLDERNRQLEIGFTQIGKAFRRTYVNTEKKYLMLRTVFEELRAVRVYFKADAENVISQNAILRIGAKFEGSLRNDCILPSGQLRDYRVYSIVGTEWSEIKDNLVRIIESYT